MCTLIIARDVFTYYPLVIAANRDESLHRPSSGPSVLVDSDPQVLAPRDEVFGGTWIGVNSAGVASAITNRDGVEHVSGRVSRGTLARTALTCRTATEAISRVMDLGGSNFNGFHLAIMDQSDGYLLLGDGGEITVKALESGLTVVTASGYEPSHSRRDTRLRAAFRDYVVGHPPRTSTFDPLFSLHDLPGSEPGESGACLHGAPDDDWVTKSSALIRTQARRQDDGHVHRYWEYFHRERDEKKPNCESSWTVHALDYA